MGRVKKYVAVTVPFTLAGAACGVFLCLLLESETTIRASLQGLERDATRIIAQIDSFQAEAHSVLAAMNASKSSFCSDAEVSFFRKLIFNSLYLRDAGRMRDGSVECSAVLGRDNLRGRRFQPILSQPDGTRLYKDFSPFLPHNDDIYGLQLGSAYVVLEPRASDRLDLINRNRSGTFIELASGQALHPGRALPVDHGVVTASNWQGRVGSMLFVTRCSTNYPNCMTTYVGIPAALLAKRSLIVFNACLGGLAAAVIGFLSSLLYLRRRSMSQQLRRAIAKERLRVVYQPIVDLATRRIVGAEALARWTDEQGYEVSPGVFVPLAEDRGFVCSITRLMLRRALHELGETLRSHPELRLSINIAAADLASPNLVPMLQRSLEQAKVAPSSVALEITESCTAEHPVAIEAIASLRKLGYRVHIDDFGTGYSSLSYLHALSIDAIKIDRSFTKAVGTEAVTVAILPQILSMAEDLNLEVIVEGIETEVQARYFSGGRRTILAQGFYFGDPVSCDEFQRILKENI
jgi:sensor c-di-GMP phosphodiesterase-like protein